VHRTLLALGLGMISLFAPYALADNTAPDGAAAMANSAVPSSAIAVGGGPVALANSGATVTGGLPSPDIGNASLLPLASAAGSANGTVLVLAMDRILPGATESALKGLLPQEARAVLNLYLLGSIRQWYFRQDRPGAVFIVEASSQDNARQLLNDLPMVKAGLVAFDLIPIGPYIPLATLLQHEPAHKSRKH